MKTPNSGRKVFILKFSAKLINTVPLRRYFREFITQLLGIRENKLLHQIQKDDSLGGNHGTNKGIKKKREKKSVL